MRHKVLIVHPNDMARHDIQALLESNGYETVTAGTVPEGRDLLDRAAPDLLITEVRVNEYNGLQLLATSRRPVAAIVLTGHPDPVLESDARAFGAEFVLEPLSAEVLLDLVRHKLAAGQPSSDSRRWARAPVTGDLHVAVAGAVVRVLNVCPGGGLLEVTSAAGEALARSGTLVLSVSDLTLQAAVAWTASTEDSLRLGAAVAVRDRPIWSRIVEALGDPAPAAKRSVSS